MPREVAVALPKLSATQRVVMEHLWTSDEASTYALAVIKVRRHRYVRVTDRTLAALERLGLVRFTGYCGRWQAR